MSRADAVRRVETLGVLAAALHAAGFAALFMRGGLALQCGVAVTVGLTLWSWLRRGFRPRPWAPIALLLLFVAAEAAEPQQSFGLSPPGLAFVGLLLAAVLLHGRWSEALDPAAGTRGPRLPHDEAEDRSEWRFEELVRIAALTASSVALGTALLAAAPRGFIGRLYDALPQRQADLLATAAAALAVVLAARLLLAAVRRWDLTPERAEMQLYDAVWQEHAGEFARQSRWFAWAGRKARRRDPLTARPPAASPEKSRPPP